jgi:hypothetical protein
MEGETLSTRFVWSATFRLMNISERLFGGSPFTTYILYFYAAFTTSVLFLKALAPPGSPRSPSAGEACIENKKGAPGEERA